MDNRKKLLTIEQIKSIDLVDYLATLGFSPTHIRNEDYWYLSPLRKENTPSFKVQRKLNVWYDHGEGRGGNIVTFGMLYHSCTFPKLVEILSNADLDNAILNAEHIKHPQITPPKEAIHSAMVITAIKPISHYALVGYLKERRIPLHIAEKYCQEIHYLVDDRSYFGIGFQNDLGAYEVRNPYAKIAIPPKTIRSISNGGSTVYVFEGFFDFLSFLTVYPEDKNFPRDYLILNSISLFEKGHEFMEMHAFVKLFLDHDNAGKKWTSIAKNWGKKYEDESGLYAGYKDFNQWLTQFGNGQARPETL